MKNQLLNETIQILKWWMFDSKWSAQIRAARSQPSLDQFIIENDLIEFYSDIMMSDDLAELQDSIDELSNGQLDPEEIKEEIEASLHYAYSLLTNQG